VVAGVVRDAQGKPVAEARLQRKRDGSWSGERLDADGTFRIRGLEAGPVTLRATGPGRRRDEKDATEVTVPAGTENVVLVVDAGLTLTVRIANASERTSGRIRVTLLRWEKERWERQESESADRDRPGQVTFLGLRTGERYAVAIAPEGDDLFAFQGDVQPGEVTVRLERGRTIRGRLTLPDGGTRAYVGATNDVGLRVTGTVQEDGAYEIRGVPDGRWTVSATCRVEGTPGQPSRNYRAEGQTDAGGTLDLTLQAR
jgi:hypothetical protein